MVKTRHRYIENALLFTVMMMAVFLINRFIMIRTMVDGYSMYPTLCDGDNVIVFLCDKKYDRYDIVTVKEEFSGTGYIIKRIIGLPGENVCIDASGNIYINGSLLKEHYGSEKIENPGRAGNPGGVLLDDDEYFVMGDNRNHSEDSRFDAVGNVKAKDISGVATIRISPISKFGYIDLYRERTGS